MKILSARTEGRWQSLVSSEQEVLSDEAVAARRGILTVTLTDALLSQNLVVLTGLGTSMCVHDEEGQTLAPTMKALWAAVENVVGKSEMNAIAAQVKYPLESGENIELLLSHCQLAQLFSATGDVDDFINAAEKIIVERCRFVVPGIKMPVHTTFLRKCARRGQRLGRMRLFTTNYDLTFEVAASSIRFVVIDGFSHAQPHVFDGQYFAYDLVRRTPDNDTPTYLPNVFHLYKLHGSVDWQFTGEEIRKNSLVPQPMIIYPRVGKFEASYDYPFLELMSKFQSEMREPNTAIVVIGCGFRDKHVSQPFLSAVRSNVNARIIVVDPTLENSNDPVIRELQDLAIRGDTRITLVSASFEEFVSALPDLVPPTEAEQHQNRLRTLPSI